MSSVVSSLVLISTSTNMQMVSAEYKWCSLHNKEHSHFHMFLMTRKFYASGQMIGAVNNYLKKTVYVLPSQAVNFNIILFKNL